MLLEICIGNGRIRYSGRELSTRNTNLFRLVAFVAWKRIVHPSDASAASTKEEILEVLNARRSSPIANSSYRRIVKRIIDVLRASGFPIIETPNGTSGPFALRVDPVNIKFDCDGVELMRYLNVQPRGIAHNLDPSIDQVSIMTALVCLNLAEKNLQEGKIYENNDDKLFNRIKLLFNHAQIDIRILSRLVVAQYLIRKLNYTEAGVILNYVDSYLRKNEINDPYLTFKAKVYSAWVSYRQGKISTCARMLDELKNHRCDDRKLLAHYNNLYGLIIRERTSAMLETETSRNQQDIKDNAKLALQYHQKALLLQMHANDVDGIQNTCTSLAGTFFYFVERKVICPNTDETRTAFKWLLTSLAINHDFLVGGYSFNNVIVLSRAMLSLRFDFVWLKQVAMEVGESAFNCLKDYNSFPQYLEDKLKEVNIIKNMREKAYILEALAFSYQQMGDFQKACAYGNNALEIFCELNYTRRASTMRAFLVKSAIRTD